MKTLLILLGLVALTVSDNKCYDSVVLGCKAKDDGSTLPNCDASYGSAGKLMGDLQSYVNEHITRSFDYLLLSTNFASFEKNRIGFEKLFRKLSDSTWEDSIDLIKYITKRGGQMDFNARKEDKLMLDNQEQPYDTFEVAGLALALDSQKILAEEANHIHREATRQKEKYHDPEVGSYLENNFLHKFSSRIREFAGHINDLKQMITDTRQSSLAVFLFDEYLKSIY